MIARRILMIAISAATGTCFAVLAGLSISDAVVPVRSFHVFSLVIAAVSLLFGYLAFRAAIAGWTGQATLLTALAHGIVGALLGLLAMGALHLMFGNDSHAMVAHALGRPALNFTIAHVLLGSALLGFGAGFVVRVRTGARSRPPRS